jgi:hypothetical protein
VPEGVLTFKRQVIPKEVIPHFRESRRAFRKVIIKLDGTIEDSIGTLQVISKRSLETKSNN